MKKILLLSVVFYLTTSCSTISSLLFIKKDVTKDVKTLVNDKTGQVIKYVGITHIGKKGYYSTVKKTVEHLRNSGYKILYEGVDDSDLNEQEQEYYWKKFRRATGYYPIYNKENEGLIVKFKSDKYEMQFDHDYGIDPKKDILFDITLRELIDNFEKKYYKIELNECDHKTALNQKYKCSKIDRGNIFRMAHVLREDYLIDRLKKMEFDKIAIVFGQGHYVFMYPNFIKMGFRELSKKEAEKFK